MRTLIAAALLVAIGGCGDPKPPYRIVFHTMSDRKAPMAGVVVEVTGIAGTSDAAGNLVFDLQGTEGTELGVKAACPERFHLTEAPRPVTLRTVQAPNGGGLAPIEVTLTCAPSERNGVVVISLGTVASGLPVSFDEEQVGVTDASGTMHIPFAAAPSTRFRVKVDTTARPDLIPPNPSMSFAVLDEDVVFKFDRKVESSRPKAAPPRKSGGRRKKKSGSGPGPVRL